MCLCGKVGAVYYVRKRIPRAWQGRVAGDVLRLSLGTKDRAQALRWGLEALVVFEQLLGVESETRGGCRWKRRCCICVRANCATS